MAEELVISCMDRRLNLMLEEEYVDAIVVRNAGANVAPLMQMIKQIVMDNNIRRITLITHDDCGAMKKAFAAIKEGAHASEDLEDILIKQFRGINFSDRQQLEEKNTEMQLAGLKREFTNIDVQAKPAKMSEIKVPPDDKEHKLLVLSPGEPGYGRIFESLGLDPFQCYIIQASIANAMPDIELAAKDLHAKEIYFVTLNQDNPRKVKRDADTAALRLSAIGAEVKRQDMRTKGKNLM